MDYPVRRRMILKGAVAGLGAALLAACGNATPTATTSTGGAATKAPTTGAAGTTPTTAAATGGGVTATTGGATGAATATRAAGAAGTPTGFVVTSPVVGGSPAASPTFSSGTGNVVMPKTGATAFQGKRLSYFQKTQYYKAVQDAIGKDISDYVKSVGADVELSIAGTDASQNLAKIQAGVQSGNPFDLADDIGPGIGQIVALNLVENVNDLSNELIKAYGTPMPIVAKGLTKDNTYFAVPFFSSSDAWFVRKDKMEAKGIKPETLDTYDKMRDAALAISDPSQNFFGWGFSPYAVGDGPSLITHLVNSWGGAIQDKTGTKVVWYSPETVAGITWLSNIYTDPKYKNMLPTGYESWDGAGNNNAWLNGTIGITSNAFTLYAKAKDDKNPVFEKTYVATRPKGPAVSTPLTGGQNGYFVIYRGAKNADLARETIKYIMEPDNWFALAKQAGGLILPAFESQWKNDFWKSDPNFATLEQQVRDPQAYNQQYYPGPVNPAVDAVISNKVLENMMAGIIQKGQKPDAAVKDAHDQMVKIFEQFGLKQ